MNLSKFKNVWQKKIVMPKYLYFLFIDIGLRKLLESITSSF